MCEGQGGGERSGGKGKRWEDKGQESAKMAQGRAAEIQKVKGGRVGYVLQQRLDVLAHVVVARAFPVALGMLFIVRQIAGGDVLQVFRTQWHAASFHTSPY